MASLVSVNVGVPRDVEWEGKIVHTAVWGNGMVRVRRERRLVHSGCKSHPGAGSFRPVAIGAAAEVTKLLKPPVESGRKGDSASVQAVT